jgi:pSer/pThr/pTyr-binding forkhead associated (FHA) protein
MPSRDRDGGLEVVPTLVTGKGPSVEDDDDGAKDVTQLDTQAAYPEETLPAGIIGQLTFLDGPEEGRLDRLLKPYTTIGRHPASDLWIADPAASGTHAAVILTRSLEWWIEDLGSRNGTELNGVRIRSSQLRAGDRVQIGSSVLLFRTDDEEG